MSIVYIIMNAHLQIKSQIIFDRILYPGHLQ